MSVLRFPAAVLVAMASIVPALTLASAQSPASAPNFAQTAKAPQEAPPGSLLRIPPLSRQTFTIAEVQPVPAILRFVVTPSVRIKPQLAQNDGPCYTLRSYGFTDHDLQSADPRPSSATTCTPAASGQMKQALSSAAKLKR